MKKKKTGTLLMIIGALLMTGAVCLTVYNVWESQKAEKAADDIVEKLLLKIDSNKSDLPDDSDPSDNTPEDPDYITYPDMQMPTIKVENKRYIGYLEIPDLGLTLPIAGEEWDMEDLASSPCLYYGSIYTDNAILAGHNYTVHFGKLSNLHKDSAVIFTDAEGNTFEYKVAWTETIAETDTEGMVEGDDWDLTLFTCNYTGDKRFTVRCIKTNK